MERSRSVVSSASGGSSIREISEEEEGVEREEKVYVAVKKELKEGKATLLWLLQNTTREKKIVITHVHVPAQMIPMMGSKFPANQVKPQLVKEYRDHEREKVHRSLEDYVAVCSQLKARAEKLVFEAEDVAKGLLEVVALHGVTKLVMGAAADKKYSRKMKEPRSKTSITMKQQAKPFCRIWFVCKGSLICTRDAVLDASWMASPSTSIASSTSIQSEQLRSISLPQEQVEPMRHTCPIPDLYRSRSDNLVFIGGGTVANSPTPVRTLASQSRFSSEGAPTIDPWDGISSRTTPSSNHSVSSASDDIRSNSDFLSLYRDGERSERSTIPPLVEESDDDVHFSSPPKELEDGGLDAEVYDKLQEAMAEAENLRHEAYRESLRRQTAERKAIEALKRAKASESLYAKEVKQRKDIEESLAREMVEIETLKDQRDKTMEQCKIANMQKEALELQIVNSNSIIKDLEEKLLEARRLFDSLQVEHEELQLQQDASVREAEELRQKIEAGTTKTHGPTHFSEFSYSEIEQATCNFSSSFKIGEGGYGSVYKGFLRNTIVAIKMLNPDGMQGQSEFHQEVNTLSRVRHPNLVTLIGACSERWALIYEFLPCGSLEDRLDCKNNSPPLTWQARTRIATEICSALIFLHSNKPHSVVHGDLKPDNIFLDANLVSKLGDFGICRLILQSTTTATLYCQTTPKGTFAYMDPEFQATGELTPQSDVYSFGVILLRLLTGKQPFGLVKEVKNALDKGLLQGMIDPSAGNWPFVQAKQLAHLGLRCCEMSRKCRPDLVGDVWRVLEPMMMANPSSVRTLSFGSFNEDNSPIPNYFICPIFQEIMRDPQIASDGFTYEAEAVRGWIDSGHDTSPMTNLKLPHLNLIPNRALHSAIQEWLQQHQQL
ncbi:U-box domain-containing protein 33-like isoform X1 [Iris pallida]|uniref:RING-type E3 ubiquitin transferase n=1 Tax=Iris pallida TaxID=29817 RepID=A0AAX6HJK3_IRIPA|nr:U-box domain-containing protein 33-like isoform X1 [Iris pallida]